MRKLNLILITLIAVFAVGCAEDKGNGNAAAPVAPVVTDPFAPFIPPAGPGLSPGDSLQFGATTELDVTNSSLAFYTGWTPNVLTNVQVNLNLQRFEPASGSSKPGFGGTVTIAFENNGVYYQDSFSSLINESHPAGEGNIKSNSENHRYNVWFTQNGQNVWHGFFQDNFGAVIVVIDGTDDEGDGQGPSSVSGSIWVMNFPNQFNSLVNFQSPTSCWFISLGPYDCRTWKVGHAVDTEMALYPFLENSTTGTNLEPKPEGYRKVGDFEGLNFQEAFNGEGQF